MTPTIEEVKKVAAECGAVKLGDQTYFTGREWAECVRLIFDGDTLQTFAQHWMKVQMEIDAAWEAEKLEPLRREVSMLHTRLERVLVTWDNCDEIELINELNSLLENTQATAEAYEREVELRGGANALKAASEWEWTGIQNLGDREFVKEELLDAANKGKEIV